jgi:hypothetical protein
LSERGEDRESFLHGLGMWIGITGLVVGEEVVRGEGFGVRGTKMLG